jgi:hypothetical protein
MTDGKRLYKLQGGLIVPTKSEPEVIPEKKLKIKSIIDRKTITVYKSEYDEWEKIKEEHSWTSLLKTVREGYLFFKQVMSNLTVKIESSVGTINRSVPSRESLPSLHRTQKTDPNSPKAQVLAEIKKATEGKMSIEEFRSSMLKPLTKEELENIQKSEEELKMAQNKEIRLEDLKTPK